MNTVLTIFAISFLAGLILTPLARSLATRFGLVDQPDGRRKTHARSVPVAGGVPLLVAGTIGIVAALVGSPMYDRLAEQRGVLIGLLLGSLIIVVVGVVDDLRVLRGLHKLIGQVAAVGVIMASGVVVQRVELFDRGLNLGLLALPFTAFWLLGAVNSLNLMDGMDGMLSCAALIISLAMGWLALMSDQWAMACVAAALCGGLLAFLRFNFPPATIFLGDSGSMLVGLVIGVLTIQSPPGSPGTLALVVPVAVMIIPIFDTTAAIIRRKLTGRSIYATDRGHLHHCLLRSGLSTRHVLLWVSFLSFLTLVGALATRLWHNEIFAVLTAVAVVCILIGTRLFGYAETQLVKNSLLSAITRVVGRPPRGGAHQIEIRLQGSANWTAVWTQLIGWANEQNVSSLLLDVNAPALHEGYHARWMRPQRHYEDCGRWRAEIPLMVDGHNVGRLEVVGPGDNGSTCEKITSVARLMEQIELPLSGSFARLSAGTREVAVQQAAGAPETGQAAVCVLEGQLAEARVPAAGNGQSDGHARIRKPK